MPGRRISPLFAVFIAAVVLFASHSWLAGIFGYGEIATDIPFLLAGAILFLAWRVNRRAANRRSSLFGSARFGDRGDVRRLEGNGGLLIGRAIEGGKLLRYDGPAHLLTVAPTHSGKGVSTIIPNLLTLDRSVVCIDPKGKNARVTPVRGPPRAMCGAWTPSASPDAPRPATTLWRGSIRPAPTWRKTHRRSPAR